MTPLTLPRLSVLNYAAASDEARIEAALRAAGYNVVTLNGADVVDKGTLMTRIAADLPAFREARPHNWAAFNDALGSLFFAFDDARIALLWRDAHVMAARGLGDFMVAADVFTTEARRGVDFKVIYLGDGESFPSW